MVHAVLKPGNVAVITGAGFGGIGFAVASTLASRFSMHVVLADISRDALDEAEKQLVAQGVPEDRFETTVLDVSVPSSKGFFELADHVYQKHGHVDFLHLNAGVGGPSKSYGADMLEAFQKIMAVNLRGVLSGSATFVERMVAQDSPAAVIITGSKQGMTNPPGTGAAYNASKAAVKSYAESLAHDLLSTRVTVKLLIPGWVHSRLSSRSATVADFAQAQKPAGAWTGEQCAEELCSRLDNDEFYVLCPDNETSEQLDHARWMWNAEDITKKRPALSRWNPAYEAEFKKYIEDKVGK
ncbi:hypothetical protein Rhopal_004158-T1 [Rhodotorula paludigena]|uniref:Uncharacterized protein n=1 Tax=Rhodotorula paludigena TaxID=86838 RepID=A0AAV5GNP6_9BASI|nr:hypothetical protein Rhopal_004158-T1 [Rhodotorula paludigena]